MKKTTKSPLDLSTFEPLKAEAASRGKSSLRVVNTSKNGKRIILSTKMLEKLGNPDTVQFMIDSRRIVIGHELVENAENHKFSPSADGTIYNSAVVAALTDFFKLDFDSITSITLTNIGYRKTENYNGESVMVAVVRGNE